MKLPIVTLHEVLRLDIDAVTVKLSETYKVAGVYSFGRGLFSRSPLLGSETTYKIFHRLHKNSFVLSQLKGWEGALSLIPDEFDGYFLSPQFPTFSAIENRLDIQYLNWYCKQSKVWESLRQKSQGMGARRDSVSAKKFLSLNIPLPPIAEQRRIVARIEELAAKIEEARGLRESAIEKATLLTKASLDDIFSKSLDSPEWSLINLNSVTEIARGKFTHRPRNDPRFYGGEIPFIQIGDISGSNRYIQNHTQTLNDEGLKVSRLFPIGTVVIAITGATVGATGILTFELAFPDSIVGIIPQEELVIPEFIYWSLEFFKQIALDEAKQTTQPNINLKILNKLKIPLPSIEVQKEIVSYLDDVRLKVDQITQLRENALKEFDALLPAILDKAFKGEL